MRCQAHVKLLEVVDSVTLEEVNAIGASVLSYISHYKNEAALLEEVGPDYLENGYARPGPTRMTSIVACVPAFMDASGQSTGDRSGTCVPRHASMHAALKHGAQHFSHPGCMMLHQYLQLASHVVWQIVFGVVGGARLGGHLSW